MKPEKFENKIKHLLEEREIKPSSQSWEQLEQRLGKKGEKRRPYLLWTSAAAIAAIFFVLGTYFNAPIASEEPQLVEQTPETPIPEEKVQEPEAIQLATLDDEAAVEKSETKKKPSTERPVKNAIFETPVEEASGEENLLASENPSEATEAVQLESKLLLAEQQTDRIEYGAPSEVSDIEVEALLLLATAELKSDPAFTVDSKNLLYEVEYELEQSFRQKVFEVVKEGFSKAKTAVANRDF